MSTNEVAVRAAALIEAGERNQTKLVEQLAKENGLEVFQDPYDMEDLVNIVRKELERAAKARKAAKEKARREAAKAAAEEAAKLEAEKAAKAEQKAKEREEAAAAAAAEKAAKKAAKQAEREAKAAAAKANSNVTPKAPVVFENANELVNRFFASNRGGYVYQVVEVTESTAKLKWMGGSYSRITTIEALLKQYVECEDPSTPAPLTDEEEFVADGEGAIEAEAEAA